MTNHPTATVIRHLRALTECQEDSDEQLLLRYIARRDEAAFAALVRRHGAMVLSVCRRVLRHDHDAEDAFQATFLALARQAATVRSPRSLAAWLHGVAHRVSLRARTLAATHGTVPLNESVAAGRDSQDPSWREVSAALDDELGRLPERLRGPLVLCYLEGLTRDEAAARLGCSLGTLKHRLERGRELLRGRLQRRGLILPAVLAGVLLERVAVSRALAASTVTGAVGQSVPLRVLALAKGVGAPSPLKAAKIAAAFLLLTGALAGAIALAPPARQAPNQPQRPAERPREDEKPRLDALGDPLPDGAVAHLGSLRLFHGGTGAYRVALSPDAKLVVSTGAEGDNKLWDAVTGQELPLADGLRKALVFATKDKLLAAESVPGGYRLRDLASGKEVPADGVDVEAEKKKVARTDQDVSSPDGKLIARGDVKGVHLFDAAGKELPPPEDVPKDTPWSITFSPDGKLLAASYGSPAFVRVWDVATRKVVARELLGKDYRIHHTSFSADGKTLAGADGYGVTLWDVGTGKWLHDLGHVHRVVSLAFTPDGRTLITGADLDKVIRLWDPLTGKERGRWEGQESGAVGITLSPDGRLAAAGDWRTLRLVEVKGGREVARLGDGKDAVWWVAFSPDGKTVASTGSGAVRLWDVATGKQVRSFSEGTEYRLAFSPDGKYLATDDTSRNKVRLWEAATGQEVRQFVGRGRLLTHPAFSPDGAVLAAADSTGPARLYDVATGRELLALGDEVKGDKEQGYYALQFSPDGRTLATGSSWPDAAVRLWEVASGRERARFTGHQADVLSLAFSPDGSLLASGSADRTVVVWDVTGRHTARPRDTGLSDEELRGLWEALADADAAKAFGAVQTLAGSPRSALPFLKEHLRPAAADPKLMERLLKDLDSDQFATRDRATKEIRRLGDAAEPYLRTALDGDLSPEARRRVEGLLGELDPVRSPGVLRGPRAVEALEMIGGEDAKELLKALSAGDPAVRLTREAKASLARLSKR